MAELERLANHFGDIGAICNDASFAMMHAQTGILRERVLRAADACFGHRLMMDAIVPGGVARDIAADGLAEVRDLLAEIRRAFPRLIELYDNTASLQDRTVTTGIVKPDYVRQCGAGGYVGRASGRGFDARRNVGYAPYDKLAFDVPVLDGRRRQCAGVDPHSRGRAEPGADRPDPRRVAGRKNSSHGQAERQDRARASVSSRRSAATS